MVKSETLSLMKDFLTAGSVSISPNKNQMPTQLEYHTILSRDLNRKIFIKREDRIDDIGSGNKLRKLYYIIEDAKQKNSSVLVTVGSLPSNQCKAVAFVASLNNMKAHVVYGGNTQKRPKYAQGNYFLTSLFQPEITWHEHSHWQEIDKYLEAAVQSEINRNEKPYVIKSGASEWPGLLGSIELGIEIICQAKEMKIENLNIVSPAGSGGTCLGINIALEYLKLPWKVHGICIGEPADSLIEKLRKMKEEVANIIPAMDPSLKNLFLYDDAIGIEYDHPSPNELFEMRAALQKYQLIFDPNYMLKTFIGMKKLIQQSKLDPDIPILLIHTGGHIGIFDFNSHTNQWHHDQYKNWLQEMII